MDTENTTTDGEIHFGRFSYSHNSFLVALACLAAAAFGLADWFGVVAGAEAQLVRKIAAPQMIWALLLLPIGAFGAWAFNRSGHRDTATACGLAAVAFLAGAAISTFLL